MKIIEKTLTIKLPKDVYEYLINDLTYDEIDGNNKLLGNLVSILITDMIDKQIIINKKRVRKFLELHQIDWRYINENY